METEKTISTFKSNLKFSKRAILSALALVFTLSFTYLQVIYYLLPGIREIINLRPGTATIQQIGLIWIPIISYFLISFNICFLINIFKKLLNYEEKGLIYLLVYGFKLGIICSIIFGIIFGFITGSIFGLIYSLGYLLIIFLAIFLGIGLIGEKIVWLD
jgi:hypothetical protein